MTDLQALEAVRLVTTKLLQTTAKPYDANARDQRMQDACMVTNPRRPTQRDIEAIYEEAL